MAFPQVIGSPETALFESPSTSHLVPMPGDADEDDLLYVEFASDGDAAVTTPSGWQQVFSAANGTAVRLGAYVKKAVGDEGGTTVDFVTAAAEFASSVTYRIQAGTWYGDLSTLSDAVAAGTPATGSSSNPNPPSVTAPWGSADNLFFAPAANSQGNFAFNSPPSNYGNAVSVVGSQGAFNADIASARRQLAAASDDPGAWTMAFSIATWVAGTVVIRPAESGEAHEAQAEFTASASMSATEGILGLLGMASPTGVGLLVASATYGAAAAVAFTGEGSLSARPIPDSGRVEFNATGAASFTASRGTSGSVAFTGAGALSSQPTYTAFAQVAFAGIGTLEAIPRDQHEAQVAFTGVGLVRFSASQFDKFIPPPRIRPRLYIHDAVTLQRLAQVVNVTSINRSHALREHIRSAEFDIPISDINAPLTRPLLANVILIESNEYPHPWVGRIIRRTTNHAERTYTIVCDSYDGVLAERWLPTDFSTRSGAPAALRSILGQINGDNDTGIGLGRADGLLTLPMGLSRARGIEALDKLAENAGAEWWLSYVISQGQIHVYLNLAKERGSDFSQTVVLAQPGNFEIQSDDEDGRAIAYAQTVVGGQSSVVEAQRETATAVRDAQFNRTDQHVIEAERVFRHGHVLAGESSFRAPTQRREYLSVREELKQAGLAPDAAEALLQRQRRPFRSVLGSVYPDIEGQHATSWRFLEPGNVVRLSSADAFGTGYDGPAVVVGVQPVEHERRMDLVLEVA